MYNLLDYVEGLRVTQGAGVGEKIRVFPWEKTFLEGAFSCDGDAALSVGRGNGKTTILAAAACAFLDGPLRQPRGEVVIAASSFAQARVSYDHIRAFLGSKIMDTETWRTLDSMQAAWIEHRPSGARVRVIGCDPRRAHGMAPVLVLADEPAQWEPSKTDKMIAALRTGLGKIPGSRLVALGTRPADSENWFEKLLAGGAAFSQCHAASKEDDPFMRSTWIKANPSLPFMPALESRISQEADEARTDPAKLAEFRALRLNLGTSDILQSYLIGADEWRRIEAPGVDRRGLWALGLDLGTSTAMSAAAGYWPETGALDCVACFPEIPSLKERGVRDGVGELYEQMHERGELIVKGRRASDIGALLDEVRDEWGFPNVIVCDRWREAELRDALEKAGFPQAALDVRGQGFKDGGEDVRDFRAACMGDMVKPRKSLLMTFAMSEARVISDPAGNAKLAKSSEGGRRARARDDAAAAAILAVAAGYRRHKRQPAPRRRRSAIVG